MFVVYSYRVCLFIRSAAVEDSLSGRLPAAAAANGFAIKCANRFLVFRVTKYPQSVNHRLLSWSSLRMLSFTVACGLWEQLRGTVVLLSGWPMNDLYRLFSSLTDHRPMIALPHLPLSP